MVEIAETGRRAVAGASGGGGGAARGAGFGLREAGDSGGPASCLRLTPLRCVHVEACSLGRSSRCLFLSQ